MISWPIKQQQAINLEDILKELARYQRKRPPSIIEQLTKLRPEEENRISDWLRNLPFEAKLVSINRVVSDITYSGMMIRKVPSFRFIVEVISERNAGRRVEKIPPGNTLSLSRPTYVKIHRKHLDPETLNIYHLPWEWDAVS